MAGFLGDQEQERQLGVFGGRAGNGGERRPEGDGGTPHPPEHEGEGARRDQAKPGDTAATA